MKLEKKQNIDHLLNSYFQEEARRIQLPDSRRCWDDFQQLLEKSRQDNLYMDDTLPAAPPQKKGAVYHLMRRYRNLTALAAACVLGIMLLSGMPPAQSLREALSGMLTQTGKPSGTKMAGTAEQRSEEQMVGLHSMPADADTELGLQEAADGIKPAGAMEAPGAAAPATLPPALTEEESLRQKLSPPGAGEMGVLYHPESIIEEEIAELSFNSLTAYQSALQQNKDLIRGKIFYLAMPPQGYTFRGAYIYKSESFLHSVRQEFLSGSGDILILQQDFLRSDLTSAAAPDSGDTAVPGTVAEDADRQAASYEQVGPVYEMLTHNGRHTLHLSLEGSVIRITAELDEDGLLVVAENLAVLDSQGTVLTVP